MSAKTTVALVAAFGIGAAIGGTGVYFYTKAKYEKLVEQEVEDVRDRYRKRAEKMMLTIDNLRDEAAKSLAEDDSGVGKEWYQDHISEDGRTNYSSFSEDRDIPIDTAIDREEFVGNVKDELNKVSRAVHDDDFDRHMADREHPEDDIPSDIDDPMDDEEELEYEGQKVTEEQLKAIREHRKPYVISYDEFLHGEPEYEKIDAMYYTVSDTLVDADEEIIEPRGAAVGEEFLEKFGDPELEVDLRLVHVRNDCTRQDFEINLIPESYYPEEKLLNESDVASISFSSD